MASMVTSRVAKHILKENAKNHFGTEDPYFDYTPSSSSGRGDKLKKTRKAAPPGLTAAESKVLKKVTRRAYRLDNCFNICGFKVGWGAIIGIIPGLGDIFDVLMALMVYRTCCQADLPSSLRGKMMFNIILDFGIGLVPILGDVADAVFRANTRNAALLYVFLRERGAERIKADATGTGVVHGHGHGNGNELVGKQKPSTAAANTTPAAALASPPATRTHHTSQLSHDVEAQQTSGTIGVDTAHHQEIPHAHAHAHEEKPRTGSKGGWLSRFTGGNDASTVRKEGDLEAGEQRI